MHDTFDVDSLLALIRTGATLRYFDFWGHTPRLPDDTDNSLDHSIAGNTCQSK
jgi:hypothetical protein